MKLSEVNPYTFRNLRKVLGQREPSKVSMVDGCRADDSELCQKVVARGMLTEEQMHRAAARYRLGKSRSGKTIFWLINEQDIIVNGHIGTSWVSQMMLARAPELAKYVTAGLCLFGLHLIGHTDFTDHTDLSKGLAAARQPKTVCVVEGEETAVVLSELLPEYLWMAPPSYFTLDLLEPLKGRKVILFPRTDAAMEHYMAWLELADQARRAYRLDISVSDFLEEHATEGQKARCIDVLDYLFESHRIL